MQVFRALLLTFLLSILLSACSSGSSNLDSTAVESDLTQPVFVGGTDPAIETIYTNIVNNHPSYHGNWGESINPAITFAVSLGVTDPLGQENLAELYIRNVNTGEAWSLIDVNAGLLHDDYYSSYNGTYERLFHLPLSHYRIDLKGWEVVAINLLGDEIRRPFEFLLPAGVAPTDSEEFVYAPEYMGSISGGIEALEILTVADNNISFTSNLVHTRETPDSPTILSFEQSTFTIEFDASDSRAQRYSFWFYDGTTEINYIADASANAPSILNSPITQGQITTSVTIPWSEIYFINGSHPLSIEGLHIKLFDESTPWPGGVWFNHRSISEFVPLTP